MTVRISDLQALGDSAYVLVLLDCAVCGTVFDAIEGDFSTEASVRQWADKSAELAYAQGWRLDDQHGPVCATCSARTTSVI